MATKLKTRLEQMRQARRIHGGVMNVCTAALGVKLSRVPIPSRRLRERLFRAVYGRKYGSLAEDQLDRPLGEYRSLNELFTRGVRSELRPVAEAEDCYICPCDGTVQDLGRIHRDTLLTVKGIEYSLRSLLPKIDTQPFEDGSFAIFFLSPLDCHRVFAPQNATLHSVTRVPGHRLLVHPPFQRKEFPVFSLNERVILSLATPLGRCILVLVAGWGVGNITHPFALEMRQKRNRISVNELDEPRHLSRGEWLATFELGSTVIMLMEPTDALTACITRDETVMYGQRAYSCVEGE
ncbi:MAG: archaetidylserine decarboxylase [Pirellulales bacterium]